MSRIAYVDESQRGRRYLMAATALDPGHVAAARRHMRAVGPPGGVGRRHFVKESDAERRKVLAACAALPAAHVVVDHRGDVTATARRERCLATVVAELCRGGLARLVLDNVDDAQRRRDRQVLARCLAGTDVEYRHEAPHSREPLLWVPDAVASCAGGRPEWRAALTGWVTIVTVR